VREDEESSEDEYWRIRTEKHVPGSSESEDTEVDEELQQSTKERIRQPKEGTFSTTTSMPPMPPLKRVPSRSKFNVFKLENNWLKYESSEDDSSQEDKFSVFVENSSLSSSDSQSSPQMQQHEDGGDSPELSDDENAAKRLRITKEHRERKSKGMQADPLFHTLFDWQGRDEPVETSSHNASKEEIKTNLEIPTTSSSSSSLSPLHDSPEREIFEEFSRQSVFPSFPGPRADTETSAKRKVCILRLGASALLFSVLTFCSGSHQNPASWHFLLLTCHHSARTSRFVSFRFVFVHKDV